MSLNNNMFETFDAETTSMVVSGIKSTGNGGIKSTGNGGIKSTGNGGNKNKRGTRMDFAYTSERREGRRDGQMQQHPEIIKTPESFAMFMTVLAGIQQASRKSVGFITGKVYTGALTPRFLDECASIGMHLVTYMVTPRGEGKYPFPGVAFMIDKSSLEDGKLRRDQYEMLKRLRLRSKQPQPKVFYELVSTDATGNPDCDGHHHRVNSMRRFYEDETIRKNTDKTNTKTKETRTFNGMLRVQETNVSTLPGEIIRVTLESATYVVVEFKGNDYRSAFDFYLGNVKTFLGSSTRVSKAYQHTYQVSTEPEELPFVSTYERYINQDETVTHMVHFAVDVLSDNGYDDLMDPIQRNKFFKQTGINIVGRGKPKRERQIQVRDERNASFMTKAVREGNVKDKRANNFDCLSVDSNTSDSDESYTNDKVEDNSSKPISNATTTPSKKWARIAAKSKIESPKTVPPSQVKVNYKRNSPPKRKAPKLSNIMNIEDDEERDTWEELVSDINESVRSW